MMPAISYEEAHGAPWDAGPPGATPPPADPGEVLATLATLATLASLERGQEAVQVGRVIDLEMARLMGWALAHRPDPTRPLPMSEAERRRRELADLDVIRAMRE